MTVTKATFEADAARSACPEWCDGCMPDWKNPSDRVHQTRAFADVRAMFTPDGGEYRWHVAYLDTEFYAETPTEMTKDLREFAHELLALADHVDEIAGVAR